jgi:nucleoside-diphosphate-sugar epimerase
MRIIFLGGMNFVGPATVPVLVQGGHEVAVAHSGAHEHPALAAVEHLHGSRDELLAVEGLVERWQPEAMVDTFAGGATDQKASALAECARRAGAGHVVAVSSMDVYQYCVDAGLADASGSDLFPAQGIPLGETAKLRHGPYPGGGPEHDNVAMEDALQRAGRVTALRCGAIYGPHASARERLLVERIARGERTLQLPDGGAQVWHRVAVARVARAIRAALDHAPDDGFWACNVVDPYDWDYAALAGRIAELLDWQWEPVTAPFTEVEHPWQTSHPVLCSDERLRHVLGVGSDEPDPLDALRETVEWLWDDCKDQRRPT